MTTVNLMVRPVSAVPKAAVEPGMYLVILEEAPGTDQEQPQKVVATGLTGTAGDSATDVGSRIAALT